MTSVLPPRYVLDTSLFTQAKRSYYAFDIAQSFWQHLVKSANQGIITSIAKAEFAQYNEADAWVVAFAISNKLTVVSQETFNANIKSKIRIPNVCREFNVRHIDTFTFLREHGFSM